jgi:hypothetical protein
MTVAGTVSKSYPQHGFMSPRHNSSHQRRKKQPKPTTATSGGQVSNKEHAVFHASGSYYQTIICLPDVDAVVVVTAADDLTGSDTLGLTLDPVLEKVIFNPLLQR